MFYNFYVIQMLLFNDYTVYDGAVLLFCIFCALSCGISYSFPGLAKVEGVHSVERFVGVLVDLRERSVLPLVLRVQFFDERIEWILARRALACVLKHIASSLE